jgi:hypothetical protein
MERIKNEEWILYSYRTHREMQKLLLIAFLICAKKQQSKVRSIHINENEDKKRRMRKEFKHFSIFNFSSLLLFLCRLSFFNFILQTFFFLLLETFLKGPQTKNFFFWDFKEENEVQYRIDCRGWRWWWLFIIH